MAKKTYRLEYVNCGKKGCFTCSSGKAHGPYWYAYWREGGRVRKKYVGKKDPRTARQEEKRKEAGVSAPGRMSFNDAAFLLGIFQSASQDAARSAWKAKAREHHPDRGGDPERMKAINLAWEVVKRARGWR